MQMKALSVRQPWVWCIVHGFKPVENRDWGPHNPALRFRGPALIHASGTMSRLDYSHAVQCIRDMGDDIATPVLDTMPTEAALRAHHMGGITGIATVTGIVTEHPSPWFFGPLALVLENAKPLPFKPHKGQLGFFNVDYMDEI